MIHGHLNTFLKSIAPYRSRSYLENRLIATDTMAAAAESAASGCAGHLPVESEQPTQH
jgi:hypothetical protein